MLNNIQYIQSSKDPHQYNILYNNKSIGYFVFYKKPPFLFNHAIQLKNFLSYITINPEYRNKGILTDIINKYNIQSLYADDISNIPLNTILFIYNKLGFKPITAKNKRFLIKPIP